MKMTVEPLELTTRHEFRIARGGRKNWEHLVVRLGHEQHAALLTGQGGRDVRPRREQVLLDAAVLHLNAALLGIDLLHVARHHSGTLAHDAPFGSGASRRAVNLVR